MPPPIQCKYCGAPGPLDKAPYCSVECRELSEKYNEELKEEKKPWWGTLIEVVTEFIFFWR